MGFCDVPIEILLCIADHLQYSWQVNALGQTCRGFHNILNPYLYRFNKKCSRSSAFYDGIRKGLHDAVERLLTDMVSSNTLDEAIFIKGLEMAVGRGQLHILQLLIHAADHVPQLSQWPTILNTSQSPIFWRAARQPNEPIVRLLLEHGVVPPSEPYYPNLGTAFREHPSVIMAIIDTARWLAAPGLLSLADMFQHVLQCRKSNTAELINRLVEKGVDPSLPIGDGENPFLIAISSGNHQGVQCLLENGVSPEMADGTYLTPLALTVQYRDTETAKLLLEKVNTADILARGTEVGTLFCAAVACGSQSMVEELLRSGCHPDTTMERPPGGPAEDPAIVWASKHRQEEMTRLLLERGAKVHPRALAAAVCYGSLPIMEMLLDAGADPNSLDGKSPLLMTAVLREDAFRLLLKRGAVLHKEEDRRKILMQAIRNGKISQVQILLDQGMSLDGLGDDVLYAAVYGRVEMLEFIIQHGYKHHESPDTEFRDSPLRLAFKLPDFAAFKWLIDKGLCKFPRGKGLWEMLVRLFEYFTLPEAEQALNLLASRGANIHTPAGRNKPLVRHYQAHPNESLMKAFMDRGAKPILRDGASSKDIYPHFGSLKALDLVLQWVVANCPHSQAKMVLSSMKENAEKWEKWRDLRHIYRFEDSNGLA